VTEHIHWTWVFFINVPIGIVGLIAGARLIPESRDPDAPPTLDVPGVAVGTGALVSLTYALLEGNDYGWGSPVILALLGVAAIGFAAFVAIELRSRAPMVDLSLFRNGTFSGANVVMMVITLATFGVLLYTSLYLQEVLHFSPVRAGATLLPWVLIVIVVAPFGGKLTELISVRWLVTFGTVLMGLALLMFSRLGEGAGFVDMLPPLLVGGLGGALTTPLSTAAIGAVPSAQAGIASGIHNTFRETGGSFGIAIVGAVFAAAQSHALAGGATAGHAFVSGYSSGLVVASLIVFASAVVAAVMLRVPRVQGANNGAEALSHA
jgi:EmrB/QacA subfamily drug resistance transporter